MTISALRTVVWQPPIFGALVQSPLVWPSVLTADILDYGIDISLFVADLGSDTISTVTAVGAPSGLTITSVAMTGNVIGCLITGGVTGATHQVDFTLTTTGGKVQIFTALLPIGLAANRLAPTFVGAQGPAGPSSTGYTFNVLDYGAVADNSTDIAIALRTIAALMSSTTANKIIIPAGAFAWKSAVTFTGVAPIIEGQGFTAGAGSTGTGTRITISGTGYTPCTFTGTNARGAIVRDIAFTQVQPTPGASWAPTAYDYIFRVQDCLGEVTFDNVLFSGVTKGIFCDNSGRLRIRGITGQFFQNGVSISHCLDIPRIDNIHSWPYWSKDSNVLAYQRDNLDVVTFKRCDGVFIGNLFGYCGRRLIYVTSDTVAPTGTLTRGFVNNMYADGFKYSIYADSDSADFMVSNLSHQGFDPNNGTTPITGGSALVLTGSFCQVMVTNFFTDIAGTSPVVVQGAGNYLWFNSFAAGAFQSTGTGTPAIAVTTNAVPNSVSIANTPRLRGTLPLTLMNSPAVVLTNRPLMQQEAGGPSVNELRGYTGLSGSGSARLGATGGDTNINLDLNPQGAGAVRILGSAGYVVFRADDGAAATGATGLLARPASDEYRLIVEGAATAANLSLYPKGASGSVRLKGGYGYPVVDIDDANNALGASSLLMRSGGGGGEFQIIGIGTATKSDIDIYPKGTGVLKVNGSAVALLASPAFTGTPTAPTATAGTNSTQVATTAFVQTARAPRTFTATYASTITIDWSLYDTVRVTLTGNITITNTNAVDGQRCTIEATQDATGSRSIAFTSEAKFGTDITSIPNGAASTTTEIGLIYNSSSTKYRVAALAGGF